ncbi:Hypothetical_protein [Hexamita inflata]|uniref:Hypothetical_protein n=1 Tax=Hexamita inflata TaxID=28002 RepID=A0AA86Q854_9EUKA|nr:Hypothetical protein HINF_LOCUS11168 [Hexamita inflata]CAI9954075.1 Hypothetical protein HINF_LOCUS41720 [Hexamita inflata]CAI9963333.1 Hypothetical protein HINF_LOCUS50978 [Hexamita inflata]
MKYNWDCLNYGHRMILGSGFTSYFESNDCSSNADVTRIDHQNIIMMINMELRFPIAFRLLLWFYNRAKPFVLLYQFQPLSYNLSQLSHKYQKSKTRPQCSILRIVECFRGIITQLQKNKENKQNYLISLLIHDLSKTTKLEYFHNRLQFSVAMLDIYK